MVCRCHRPEGPLMMIMGSPLSTEVLPLSLLLAHFLSPPHPISSSTPIPFAFYYLSHPSFSSLLPCPFPFLFSSSFFRFSSFYSLPLEPIFLPSHRMTYVKLTETNRGPWDSQPASGPPRSALLPLQLNPDPLALHPPEYHLFHIMYTCYYAPARLRICAHCSLCLECPSFTSPPSEFLSFYSPCRRHHCLQNPFLKLLLFFGGAGTPLLYFSHCIQYVYLQGSIYPGQGTDPFLHPWRSWA